MTWISVKDELPEKLTKVLVTGSVQIWKYEYENASIDSLTRKFISISLLDGDRWCDLDGFNPSVTHWMKLPNLPIN